MIADPNPIFHLAGTFGQLGSFSNCGTPPSPMCGASEDASAETSRSRAGWLEHAHPINAIPNVPAQSVFLTDSSSKRPYPTPARGSSANI
jgi:hypothetical protein